VGDRGITLSGGQKARISLARAVYTNRDIILLDDPLSAVDSEVSETIFNHCIKSLLKEKTVILATHQIHVLANADKILVLSNGGQIFFGVYEELKEREDISDIIGELFHRSVKEISQIPDTKPAESTKTKGAKDKLSIEEEERAIGQVPLKIYIRFFKYAFRSLWILPIILVCLLIPQVTYIAVV